MQIEYVTTGTRRNVSEEIGETLVFRKIARRVYETREVVAEQVTPARKTRAKRQYKRRDMQAEG